MLNIVDHHCNTIAGANRYRRLDSRQANRPPARLADQLEWRCLREVEPGFLYGKPGHMRDPQCKPASVLTRPYLPAFIMV